MTTRVLVNLYSAFRIGRFAEGWIELPDNAALTDLLKKLKIPLQDIGVVMVNARNGTYQQKLQANDNITLIPRIDGG